METHRPNCLTPAKQKAAVDDECLSKKFKVDGLILADQTAEETPEDQTAEEDQVEEISDYASDYSDSEPPDVEDIEIPDIYKTDKEKEDFKQYVREYRASEGFDVVTFVAGGIKPLHVENEHGTMHECKAAVANAIRFKNKQMNTNLKLVEVTKCNFMSPAVFYATFIVEDPSTGDRHTYQAKLYRHLFTGETEIFKFRVKPGTVPVPQPRT